MSVLSPTGISRPFDNRRDGFVMGEGAAVLVLEDGESARARGANILATVRGYGATGDAHHLTAPESDANGGARAMADAGLTAADVDYVNAHGTSTQLDDRSERAALKTALGEDGLDLDYVPNKARPMQRPATSAPSRCPTTSVSTAIT